MENGKNWHYDTVAILAHWIIAALLTTLLFLGWYMLSIEDQPNSAWYFSFHKSLGITVALLILFRLGWRITHQPQSLPASVPRWQAKLSEIVHWSLYIFMILMPLAGFLGAAFSKHGIVFWGWQLPKFVNQDHNISKQFFEIHSIIAWILVGLISAHILAAFKHSLFDKDNVFQRMWFR